MNSTLLSPDKPVAVAPEAPRAPVFRREMEDNLCHLIFDQPGSSANVFSMAALNDLWNEIEALKGLSGLRGIIIRSAKPDIFCAGADLQAFRSITGDALREFILLGQRVFRALAELPVRKVAAIHGACVGGGCELALACDVRIATDASSTKIGLPETNLGILPGWGGCTRLPRLIGLPAALSVILPGAIHPARKAKKLGVVDEVVPREHLLRTAVRWIDGPLPRRSRHWVLNNALSAKIIARRARRDLMKKTGGHYPAPFVALDVAVKNLRSSWDEALTREREGIVELAASPKTAHLMNTFMHREKVRRASSREGGKSIQNVAVIGAGVMGSGIAQWMAAKGIRVLLQDVNDAALAKGMERIRKLFKDGVKHGHFRQHEAATSLDRITPSSQEVSLKRMDLVIEAAVEDPATKRQLFAKLAARARPDTIFATNTSALHVGDMLDSPRMVGMHFFNPVHKMPLVEIVRPTGADPAVVVEVADFARRLGKLPVVVADQPGFVVNRILMPYLMMAGELVADGMPAEELDMAMRKFGMPMGPMRLLDEVGLDVALHVGRTLAAAYPDRMSVPPMLAEMVAAGKLGKKSGSGFYQYPKGGPDPADSYHSHEKWHAAAMRAAERLARVMSAEAARCLEDRVAESAEDIDFAMIAGTGYPAFRGGPLTYSGAIATGVKDHSTHATL
jgi:3-hydroxyacyl-CoA dehydrogenase/enoyl-CoA hydratase/3-hydroxybutyryl-CoA epimerase